MTQAALNAFACMVKSILTACRTMAACNATAAAQSPCSMHPPPPHPTQLLAKLTPVLSSQVATSAVT
jgi:hypothetical protein